MPERYSQTPSLPDGEAVEGRVEQVLGRDIEGVTFVEGGLDAILLADGDSLSEAEQQALAQEFGGEWRRPPERATIATATAEAPDDDDATESTDATEATDTDES